MSLFESETEKLKQRQRRMEYNHEQAIAGLNQKLQRQEEETAEYADAESRDMMDKIEKLEKQVAELGKQIEELKSWL
ncbi:hypothetical protein MUP01_10865 [Candidatus Bathyarchaeota archaeon]|nr:hypothetical protein [Candidatus Bathyarchaeota archaeon]